MAVDETINNLIKELKQERKGHHKVSDRWLLSSLQDRESMIGKFFTSLFKEYMEFPDYIFIDLLTAPPPPYAHHITYALAPTQFLTHKEEARE